VSAIQDDDKAFDAGAVYVFEFDGTWVQGQKLQAPTGVAGDLFGESVDLEGDRILVGGGGRDDHGANSGAGYVWELQGSTWVQTAMLTASDGIASALFGLSCALSGDRAAFGAPLHSTPLSKQGKV